MGTRPIYYLIIEKEIKNGRIIYGAIWVFDSNGAPTLKPVAKMNEVGVLCLI